MIKRNTHTSTTGHISLLTKTAIMFLSWDGFLHGMIWKSSNLKQHFNSRDVFVVPGPGVGNDRNRRFL